MRQLINFISQKISSFLGTAPLKNISEESARTRSIVEGVYIENYLRKNLLRNKKYIDTRKITHFHKSVFTQNGEDGIIAEIFKRIQTTNKYFVEFGVHGVKNNSTLLLVKGWSGLWIGGNNDRTISGKFRQGIDEGKLKYVTKWITKDNIENIFAENMVPPEFDFLSIDLDGNDYWIWKTIQKYSPRVICIEYNATFPPDISWVMAYDPTHIWDQTNYFGASLKALEKLGKEKGYVLIGCDFTGCNAFFLRDDQNKEIFDSPFTAVHHYEPPRYFLSQSSGHEPGFGPFSSQP